MDAIARSFESLFISAFNVKKEIPTLSRLSLPASPISNSLASSRSTSVLSSLSLEDLTVTPAIEPSPICKSTHPLDTYTILQTLGTGCIGRVHLAQSRINNQYYAIKALSKYDVVRLRQTEHVNNERSILSNVSHPFTVNLIDTFQNDTHLFLVMDYAQGGEMFRLLRQQKRFSESAARFYAMEMILALEYLHERNIAYRDIKPENILLDHEGHVKLVDFGFAKKIDTTTYTVCGTPQYFAPEIIKSNGYSMAVDWWGMGVLIYEMIVGRPPFMEQDPVALYEKILNCHVTWPEDISSDARDLIEGLLNPEPTMRYGHTGDIKTHSFFGNCDFNDILERKIEPPFKPSLNGPADSACFARYDEPAIPYDLCQSADPYRSHFPDF
ncbi:camp-dependent protein kinase catalytic subunit beta [Dichotomocladium elegans]|nr:camp-dependent protein kinase catalytic subunit beta [Dichotomocladium elegans]